MIIGEGKCGGGSADLSVQLEPFLHSASMYGGEVVHCVPTERCCHVVFRLIVVRAFIGFMGKLSETAGPTCLRMICLFSVD